MRVWFLSKQITNGRIFSILSKRGLGLTETLCALLIMIIILGISDCFFVFAKKTAMSGQTYIALEQTARVTVDTMTRGISGSDGIRQASTVNTPGIGVTNNSITFSDTDGNSRSFWFSAGIDGDSATADDNQIIYTDENGNDTVIVDKNVNTASFYHIWGGYVEIVLSMRKTVSGNNLDVTVSTQISLRNTL